LSCLKLGLAAPPATALPTALRKPGPDETRRNTLQISDRRKVCFQTFADAIQELRELVFQASTHPRPLSFDGFATNYLRALLAPDMLKEGR
jgi:hypothetical protein